MTDQTHRWLRSLLWAAVISTGLWWIGNAVQSLAASARLTAEAAATASRDVPRLIDTRAASIQSDARQLIEQGLIDIRHDLVEQVALTRSASLREIQDTRTALVHDALPKVIAGVDRIRVDAAGQLGRTNDTLAAAVKPMQESAQQVDEALPMFLECDHNADCLFSRFQGTSKAIERTAQVIAAEAPKMSAHVESVAVSADRVAVDITREADALTAPQTKMQQIKSWLIVIARVFGAL